MRSSELPIALALKLAACEPSSSGPSPGPAASAARSATATAPSAGASASAAPSAPPAEPSPDTLPENAAIHFEWFAYASLARDRHKLWLDRSVTRNPPALMLSYLPEAGKAPPDKEVSGAQREALVRVLEAAKLATRKPLHCGRDAVAPTHGYVLSVSWPREGGPPASYSTEWTDRCETADLAAVRGAMFELGSAKFPAVAKAMPKP